MKDKEQTAVQWLKERIRERQALAEPGSKPSFKPLFDKALQMEREQIIDAYEYGHNEGYTYMYLGNTKSITAQEYLKETYQENA